MTCGWCRGNHKYKEERDLYYCPNCGNIIPKSKGSKTEYVNVLELEEKPIKEYKTPDPELKTTKNTKFHILSAMKSGKGLHWKTKKWLEKEIKKNIVCPRSKEKLNPFDPRWSYDGESWLFDKNAC